MRAGVYGRESHDNPLITVTPTNGRYLARVSTAWDLGVALRTKFFSLYSHTPRGAIIQIRSFPSATPEIPHVLFSSVVGPPGSTGADNFVWAAGKANVTQRFGKSSLRVGRECVTTSISTLPT